MSYAAKVICDSLAPCGQRLTTMEIVMPRVILAEFNTARKISGSTDEDGWTPSVSSNSASSRGIPIERRIEAVKANPYIPPEWGRNQKGMVAEQQVDLQTRLAVHAEWGMACGDAIYRAERLARLKVHKQIINRLLEPFAWVTVVASGTEWANLFSQRVHPSADPAFQRTAELMLQAYLESEPRALTAGAWHLPYEQPDDLQHPIGVRCALSAARCARTSYLMQDQRRDPQLDLDLYERLTTAWPGHWSPLEHVAQALAKPETWGNFKGWKQLRKMFEHENITTLPQLGSRGPDEHLHAGGSRVGGS